MTFKTSYLQHRSRIIRNISRIRKYLNQSAAEQIIHAFVTSLLDNGECSPLRSPARIKYLVWWDFGCMLYSLGYTVEYWIQQKQPVKFDGFGTHGYMLYSLGYTVEYWIQQKQPVEFDGFGTHGYMLYSLGYTVEYWIQQKQPVEFDGFGTHGCMLYSLGYTVEYWIQQKQPVEFDGFWYTWLHALFTGLYCGVLNPTKAAGGVWWIWYTCDLFAGLYCGVLNPSKSDKTRRRILEYLRVVRVYNGVP